MFIDFLFDVFRQNAESEAVIWQRPEFRIRPTFGLDESLAQLSMRKSDRGRNGHSRRGGFFAKCDRAHVGAD